MKHKKMLELQQKLNEKIVEDNINIEELISLSQELDLLIVEDMKQRLKKKNTNIAILHNEQAI